MKIRAQALLFDNDGTLVSSLASVDRCWTRWAAEYGVTEAFGRIELHGRPAVEIVADLLPAAHVPEALARIEALEVEDVPNDGVHLLPGTRAFCSGVVGWYLFLRDRAGRAAGRAAGMTTVALTTTHQAHELDADLVVKDLSALSALVGDGAVEISARV